MSSLGTAPRPFLSLQKTYGLLTKVQAGSAIVFSTFAVMHGAQILTANVGGSALANNWIMLGRPFYQDEHLEGILVTGSALTHVVAGLAKLGIRLYWNNKLTIPNPALLPHHALAGYLLIPLAGLHYYLVRHLPVDYYGDSSFIDFGYVAWGLQNKPVFTYGLHIALIAAGAYHLISGTNVAFQKLKSVKKQITHAKIAQHGKSVEQKNINDRILKKQMFKHGLVASVSVALISGLIIIGRDTKKIPLRLDFAKIYASIL